MHSQVRVARFVEAQAVAFLPYAGPSGGKKAKKSNAKGAVELGNHFLKNEETDWAAFIKNVPRTLAFAGFHEIEVPDE